MLLTQCCRNITFLTIYVFSATIWVLKAPTEKKLSFQLKWLLLSTNRFLSLPLVSIESTLPPRDYNHPVISICIPKHKGAGGGGDSIYAFFINITRYKKKIIIIKKIVIIFFYELLWYLLNIFCKKLMHNKSLSVTK